MKNTWACLLSACITPFIDVQWSTQGYGLVRLAALPVELTRTSAKVRSVHCKDEVENAGTEHRMGTRIWTALATKACQVSLRPKEWWFDVHSKGAGRRRPRPINGATQQRPDVRSEGFPRTRITKSSCACDCGRGSVSGKEAATPDRRGSVSHPDPIAMGFLRTFL